MSGHGPDAMTFERATISELTPQYLDETLAFMFETRLVNRLTRFALETEALQSDYPELWSGLSKKYGQSA
jgi:homogentisate 1,2-dioxygenase